MCSSFDSNNLSASFCRKRLLGNQRFGCSKWVQCFFDICFLFLWVFAGSELCLKISLDCCWRRIFVHLPEEAELLLNSNCIETLYFFLPKGHVVHALWSTYIFLVERWYWGFDWTTAFIECSFSMQRHVDTPLAFQIQSWTLGF